MTDIAKLAIEVVSKGVRKAYRDLEKFSGSSKKAESSTASLGRAALRATGAIAAIVGVSSGIRTSISIVSEFEESMSSVNAITNSTAEDMQSLELVARELGSSTAFSAAQAAQGMQFLAMAGFDTNSIMSALPDTLALARAGNLDLASAADIASNVLSGFNLQASEMARVSDVMASTASKSNTSITQLGNAMSYAAPIASSLGVSVEETAAAVGVLSDAGLQGSRAGTGLSGVFRQLSKVTSEGEKVLARYGLTSEQVNISSNGLANVIETLGKAGLTTADNIALFGAEAGVAGTILTTTGGKLDELTGKLREAEGAAKNMATAMGDNLTGDTLELRSAMSELVLTADDFTGANENMRAAVQLITAEVRDFTELLGSGQIVYELNAIGVQFEVLAQGASEAMDFASDVISDATEYWGADFDDASSFMSGAFSNIVPNIKTALQLATVEIATFIEKAKAFFGALGEFMNFDNLGDGKSLSDYMADELAIADNVRRESIRSILAERDATIKANEEKADSLRNEGDLMREEYARRLDDLKSHEEAKIATARDAQAQVTQINEEGAKARDALLTESQSRTLSATGDFFGNLAEIAKEGGKEQFENYKTLASTQALISASMAVLGVLGDPAIPTLAKPLFATAMAGLAAVQVAQIQGQEYQGARAMGGQVSSGNSYLVGENGPEIVHMNGNGNVQANHNIGGANNVTVNMTFQSGVTKADLAAALPSVSKAVYNQVFAAINAGGTESQAVRRRA